MRDPPGKEQHRVGLVKVSRVEHQRIGMKEVARMIQRHDHHHDPPHNIDGGDPCFLNKRASLGYGHK